jgi:hypothetical protein
MTVGRSSDITVLYSVLRTWLVSEDEEDKDDEEDEDDEGDEEVDEDEEDEELDEGEEDGLGKIPYNIR